MPRGPKTRGPAPQGRGELRDKPRRTRTRQTARSPELPPAKIDRGAGHGKALLAELARLCVKRGYQRLEWSVLNWNTPSIAFYESLGARPQDEWTVYRLTDEALEKLGGAPGA